MAIDQNQKYALKGSQIEDIVNNIKLNASRIAALATDFSYKGSVEDYSSLPTDASVGDVYTTVDTGLIYVWDGTEWVALNETVNVVQSTGSSTTDVMSQSATTSALASKPVITMTTTDPGEGSPLAQNNFIAVYSGS